MSLADWRRSWTRAGVPIGQYKALAFLTTLLAIYCSLSEADIQCWCDVPLDECERNKWTCYHPEDGYACATFSRRLPGNRNGQVHYSCVLQDACDSNTEREIECCTDKDFCNAGLNLNITAPSRATATTSTPNVPFNSSPISVNQPETPSDTPLSIQDLYILFIPAFSALILVSVFAFLYVRNAGETDDNTLVDQDAAAEQAGNAEQTTGSMPHLVELRSAAQGMQGFAMSSIVALHPGGSRDYTSMPSSGGGPLYLVQRTLSREVELHSCIGKGRFGEVYQGEWRDEDVAVKIFSSFDEESWKCETQIYANMFLEHPHILAFYGADIAVRDGRVEWWLVTQYHHNGSLFDYLMMTEIDVKTAIKFAYSIASGLNHLHTEIQGTQCGKRSIAHRDLKSKNILVKEDLHCCIADLGLAVMHDPSSDEPPDVKNHKVGTKRYMSPEMLKESINVHRFNAFRCADIYALGLVLWEIGRRVNINGKVLPYEIPYYDRLGQDPSIDEVYQIVVQNAYRPAIPEHLMEDSDCRHLVHTMRDCWREDPQSRVTALRIKKTFNGLRKSLMARSQLHVIAESPEPQGSLSGSGLLANP